MFQVISEKKVYQELYVQFENITRKKLYFLQCYLQINKNRIFSKLEVL